MPPPSFHEHFRAIAGRYQAVERALATFRERLRATYGYPWAIPVRNSHLLAVARRRA